MVMALVLLLTGCDGKPPQNKVIASSGSYASPDGRYMLAIQITAKKTVAYSVTEKQSGRQMARGDAGSLYQRWFFFWEPSGTLWVHSSDIGGSVWSADTPTFTQHALEKGGPWIAKMPSEVKTNLPQSLRKEWGI
jgi:hypothetical protein